MWHVDRQGAEYEKETEARVEQWNEREKEQPTAETPVVEQPAEVGRFHEDGTFHAEPHAPMKQPSIAQGHLSVSQVSETQNASTLTQENSDAERHQAQYAERFN